MSPKVVNGSFAALFDNGDDWSRKLLRIEMKDSSCKYKQFFELTSWFHKKLIVQKFGSTFFIFSDEKKNPWDFNVGKAIFFGFPNGSSPRNGSNCV